ncbi:MAG: AMP-binding protein [Pirellulaceae bacterium]
MSAGTLAARFWSNVLEIPDQPAFALCEPGKALTYRTWHEIGSLVHRWLQFFRAEIPGAVQSANITTWLENSLHWIAIDLACQTLGIVHVALDRREPLIRARELATLANSAIFISEPVVEPTVSPLNAAEWLCKAQSVHPRSPAQMLATSGTAGSSKLVVLSHTNLLSNAIAKLDAAPQYPSDLRLNILPFAHAYARTCELSTWILSRSRLAIAGNWDDWLEQAGELRPTLVNLVPYLAELATDALAADAPKALGGKLRLLQVGGAALSDELWQQLSAQGLPPLQGYGLTEASPVVCSNRTGSQRPGVIGPAVQDVELRIDEDGVLWTRGPHVMLEYWRSPELTEGAIRDGWLCTGDLVEPTGHGMRVLGRVSQQIVLSTGYKVCPEAVEAKLRTHPWIEQAVVVGDKRKHISALVWPRLHAIPADFFRAETREEPRELRNLETARWLTAIVNYCSRFNDLPSYAIPRDIRVLPSPMRVEDGTLTRKGTPNRNYWLNFIESPETPD